MMAQHIGGLGRVQHLRYNRSPLLKSAYRKSYSFSAWGCQLCSIMHVRRAPTRSVMRLSQANTYWGARCHTKSSSRGEKNLTVQNQVKQGPLVPLFAALLGYLT